MSGIDGTLDIDRGARLLLGLAPRLLRDDALLEEAAAGQSAEGRPP